MEIRRASVADLRQIRRYLDKYLRRDWFDTTERLRCFLREQHCFLAQEGDEIIGFAVTEKSGVMIRLLIRPDWRGKGIGGQLLQASKPQIIRSKSDQSSGDPSPFYIKHGFQAVGPKIGRKKNIQLMIRARETGNKCLEIQS